MMAKENLAEMPENYDMMDEVKASAVMNETEEQKIVASNVNDNQEGENPPSPKGGAATKAVEENTVNENARDISQPLTVEDIVKSKQLSPEMLAEIINAAKNDNLFPVDNLDGKELTDKINELHEWVNAEESRLKSIPFSIELYNQKKAVLQARAAYVLILECLIGEKLREIPRQNGTNENSESRASGETRTKSQIIKEEYGLSPRLARDFQHLTWDGVKAAIGLAFKQKDIPTRALALSKSASIKANQNKHNKGLKHTKFVLDYIEETEAKTLELEKPMYITTLFSNISIGLARIHELNLHCRVAAEWDKTRAHWHELLYPDCHMVQGDFTSDKCFNEALEWHKKQGCDIIMASCCCEPFSNLNNSPNKGDVPEAIGDLMSLGNGEIDPNDPWHYARELSENIIKILAHTPTGCSAWDNEAEYQPLTDSGEYSNGNYGKGFTRNEWQDQCPTITTGNGSISDVYSLHPGRYNPETQEYTDCRVFSLRELLKIMDCPNEFFDKLNLKREENGMLNETEENNLRKAIGQHFCPLHVNALYSTLPLPANDNNKPDDNAD